MQPEVTIFLTPPEALLFKDFQEYHNTFTLLCQKGVFSIKNGSVIIHFDSQGLIQKISITFQHGHFLSHYKIAKAIL